MDTENRVHDQTTKNDGLKDRGRLKYIRKEMAIDTSTIYTLIYTNIKIQVKFNDRHLASCSCNLSRAYTTDIHTHLPASGLCAAHTRIHNHRGRQPIHTIVINLM